MKAEAIALNLRGITQAYEVDTLPTEHRIMEPLFLSQPAFLLIPLPGASSVFLAPVKTRIHQASLQIPAYPLCPRAGYWNSDALGHRRRGGIWTILLYMLLLYRHHDPFFLFSPRFSRLTGFVSWSWSAFRHIPSGQYCSGLNTKGRRPEVLLLTESFSKKNGKLRCVRADGRNECGPGESAPCPPLRTATWSCHSRITSDEKLNNEWRCAGCDPTKSLQTVTSE